MIWSLKSVLNGFDIARNYPIWTHITLKKRAYLHLHLVPKYLFYKRANQHALDITSWYGGCLSQSCRGIWCPDKCRTITADPVHCTDPLQWRRSAIGKSPHLQWIVFVVFFAPIWNYFKSIPISILRCLTSTFSMTAAGIGPFEGLNHTATNVTKAVAEVFDETSSENPREGGEAATIFAWVVIGLFVLLNVVAILFLFCEKLSKSI